MDLGQILERKLTETKFEILKVIKKGDQILFQTNLELALSLHP